MKNRVLSWLLVAALLLASVPAIQMNVNAADNDLFTNATCSVGSKQSAMTNGSDEAWAVTLKSNYSSAEFVLNNDYDISERTLSLDVYAATGANVRVKTSSINGKSFISAETSVSPNQWTTVTIDLSGFTGSTTMNKIKFSLFGTTGTVYIDNVKLLGDCEHEWDYGVTTTYPTTEAEGVKTYTCKNCGETKTEAIDKLTGNNSYVQEYSLTLTDDINVNFNMNIDDVTAADPDAYVKITVDGKEYKFTAAQALAGDLTVPTAAAQMKDEIQVCVVDGQGNPGTTFTYSVYQYADYILKTSDDEALKTLVVQMLDYGAAAQAYFGHNTENPANEGVFTDHVVSDSAPADNNMTVAESGSAEGISFHGASLVAKEKVYIRYYFNIADTVDYAEFTCNGEPLKVYKYNGLYYVQVPGLNPADYDENVTVKVNGEAYAVTYSVMHYISRTYHGQNTEQGLKDLVNALYNYHLAAEAYPGN